MSSKKPFSVYRMYAEDGELIYVGFTKRGHQRQAEHLSKKSWAWEVVETQWEHFESENLALKREKAVIESENPKYNKVYRGTGEPARIEYRLRSEQYELLKSIYQSTESLGSEYRKVARNFELRIEANEKITRYLLQAVRDGRPLDEPILKKIEKYLNQSLNLAQARNAINRRRASKLNPPSKKQRVA